MARRLVSEHFRLDGKPKRKFPTSEAAQKHASRHSHKNLVIYRCGFCGGYHFATERR